jgi:hypothetical protein
VRIRIRRRGGFAGNITVGAVLDTADVPADRADLLEAAVDRLPWGGPAPVPSHPDAFRYELSLPDSPDRGTAVLGEDDVDDDALGPLLDRLRSAGAVEPPERPPASG